MLILPFYGKFRLTQGFGEHPEIYSNLGIRAHNGADWALPTGTPVRAMEGGKVKVLEDPQGYGHYVEVTGSEYKVAYAHLERALVKDGSVVSQGDNIALSNNSGFSTGPHLHVTVKPLNFDKNNGYLGAIDPVPLIGEDMRVSAGVLDALKWVATRQKITQPEVEKYQDDIEGFAQYLTAVQSEHNVAPVNLDQIAKDDSSKIAALRTVLKDLLK